MAAEHKIAWPVMEHFYTIQGEGANTGKPAYFIRLGGCDVGCVWCDVKESWDANKHPLTDLKTMLRWIKASKAQNVVITGGEPMMYDLTALTTALKSEGLQLWLETSGAYPISGVWDWICVSPKKFKQPILQALQQAHELKVVVYNKSDFDWALQHQKSTSPHCILFLQAEYSRLQQMMPQIVDFVKQHQQWRISLQTHKVIEVP
ncbi:MAG TPA: 7-carboxy-7-deazaguanine synthase QueE [Bacteroidia bacterium]|nr:7-carboxy-7-deazaguanine synthase QueE [Bacteroidia bacterium]